MIRPPLEALKRRPLETLCLAALLALAFALPGTVAIISLMTQHTTQHWLSQYEPHLYVSPTATPEQVQALSAEISTWDGVAKVIHRSPTQAIESLEKRLGKEHVQHLGLGPSMMPTSLIIQPRVPVIDHLNVIAKASGLEARPTITTVDVPSAQTSDLLQTTKTFALSAMVIMIVLYLIALFLLGAMLHRLVGDEHKELALLEQFGASPLSLVRASWIRGATMGLLGGVLATSCLLCVQFSGQAIGQSLTHSTWGVSWSWAIVFLPLVLGPIQGLVAGHVVVLGIKRRKKHTYAQTAPLLRFGPALA